MIKHVVLLLNTFIAYGFLFCPRNLFFEYLNCLLIAPLVFGITNVFSF